MATLNDRTIKRINYHMERIAKRQERLATLNPFERAYARCQAAITKDAEFVLELKAQLAAREAAGKGEGPTYVPAKPRGPRTGTSFEIVVGDDEPAEALVEFEYAANVGAVGHRFDAVG